MGSYLSKNGTWSAGFTQRPKKHLKKESATILVALLLCNNEAILVALLLCNNETILVALLLCNNEAQKSRVKKLS